jgi:glyoxylase-like metal-dependent hydrolase (beta-lactamase superfamily II)
MFTGDHVLGNISPVIYCYQINEQSSLRQYLINLDMVDKMDVRLALPAHRELIEDCSSRIEELRIHHRNRLAEIKSILAEGKKGSAEVAQRMNWSQTDFVWDKLPFAQKFFIIGETLAHINYYKEASKIHMTLEDGLYRYELI